MNFLNLGLKVGLAFIFLYELNCVQSDIFPSRILGGVDTVKGDWPFLIALYQGSRYVCGGTLISKRHVLTAAQCIQGKGSQSKLQAGNTIVRLGAYNLTETEEEFSVKANISKIHIHPDWDVYSEKYDADLAILVLSKNVEYTDYIKTVSLPADDAILTNATGSIVGWGLTEDSSGAHSEIPRKATTKILDPIYCLTTYPYLARISSVRTFCGGVEEGAPNRGDGGGGMFVETGSTWVQYGIVSSLHLGTSDNVNANTTAIYTNVKEFKDWIVNKVREPISSQRRGKKNLNKN